jgi:hypothetical protein
MLDFLPLPPRLASFADKAPDAYQSWSRTVCQPALRERWGQHWLDVVRFAETDGFEYDTHRNDAWRYRDYVIRAFNNDKPYDRFITEQLAGDEIAPKEDETLIASGLNRLGPLRKNAGNQEVASSRNEVLTEMTNAVGAAMLGVTLVVHGATITNSIPSAKATTTGFKPYFAGVYDNDVSRATPDERAAWTAESQTDRGRNGEASRPDGGVARHERRSGARQTGSHHQTVGRAAG